MGKSNNTNTKLVVTEYMLKVLDLVYREPGISISEISSRLNIPLSTTSTLIKQLKSFGVLQIKRVAVSKEISFKGESRTVKRYIRKVYPRIFSCSKDGTLIIPYLHKNNGSNYVAGVTVIACPFYKECPYAGKAAFVPGKCKLYDSLPEEEKRKIAKIVDILQSIIEVYKDLKHMSSSTNSKKDS